MSPCSFPKAITITPRAPPYNLIYNLSIYIAIYLSIISSSSCRAISTDIADPLSPPLPIVHRFWLIFRATPRIYTELLYVGSSWSPCLYSATGDISTLNVSSLKLIDKFTYLGSSVSSAETDIDTRLTKVWTANDRLSVIWNSDLTDKMKRSFFQAAVLSILLYGCTTWTLIKRMEKRLDSNYTRML